MTESIRSWQNPKADITGYNIPRNMQTQTSECLYFQQLSSSGFFMQPCLPEMFKKRSENKGKAHSSVPL